jgi:hypothetical protein
MIPLWALMTHSPNEVGEGKLTSATFPQSSRVAPPLYIRCLPATSLPPLFLPSFFNSHQLPHLLLSTLQITSGDQLFTLPPSSSVFLIRTEYPSTMANLVPGAAYHGRKTLSPLIPSHTIPDIHQDTIILGVCGVQATQQCLVEDGDGWFMSDFFAFNYLLKDLGWQQVWIAADSEHSFLDFIKDHPQHEPGFLHGNPCNERKVVFSKGLVEQGNLTPLTVCMLPTKDLILLCLTCSRSTPPTRSAKDSSMRSNPQASLLMNQRRPAP